jgi:hypothetical protein
MSAELLMNFGKSIMANQNQRKKCDKDFFTPGHTRECEDCKNEQERLYKEVEKAYNRYVGSEEKRAKRIEKTAKSLSKTRR